MSGNNILLDTNVLLYLISGKINKNDLLKGEFYISFITELELLSYQFLSAEEENKIKKLLKEIPIIDIDISIKNKTIELRKKYKLKLPDAIIIATAIEFNAILLTNDEDIKIIKEVKIKSVKLKNLQRSQ